MTYDGLFIIFMLSFQNQKIMNKLSILLAILVCCHLTLFSQPCVKEDLNFTCQAEIDNFQISHPNTTEIEGEIIIEGDDIINLNGLNLLTSIEGTLCLQKNSSLSSLTGLNGLKYVENLIIKNNDKLINLNGLGSLAHINGYVKIWYNDLLINLSGLNKVSHIGSDFMIEGNYALLDCTGLENLNHIGGSLVIGCIAGWMHHNRSLRSLSGFENLINIEGYLWINCNDSITTLSGFESLVSVGEGIIINDNKSLVSLTGLEHINSCSGCLIIGGWGECSGNPALVSLRGIENIDPESLTMLKIRNNSLLSSCAIKSVCNYLNSSEATVDIRDNGIGCNNLQEVEATCNESSVGEADILNKLSICPNPFIRETTIMYDLNEPAIVEIKIYDHLGNEIENIYEQQNCGHHEIRFDASALPSGLYYCFLESNRSIQTAIMIKM